MRRSRLARLALLAIVIGAVSGCSLMEFGGRAPGVRLSNPGPETWQTLPALLIEGDEGFGSGFSIIDQNTLVTGRHVVEQGRRLRIPEKPYEATTIAGGDYAPFFHGDWHVLGVSPALPGPPLVVDLTREVDVGETLLLSGWITETAYNAVMSGGQYEGKEDPEAESLVFVPVHVRSVVAEPPDNRRNQADELIFARTFRKVSLKGMSGGPAAVWDEATSRWVVIGIHIGYTTRTGPLGLGIRRYSVIQRLKTPLTTAGLAPSASGPTPVISSP